MLPDLCVKRRFSKRLNSRRSPNDQENTVEMTRGRTVSLKTRGTAGIFAMTIWYCLNEKRKQVPHRNTNAIFAPWT